MSNQFIFEGSTAQAMITTLDSKTDKELKGIFRFRCLVTSMDIIDIDAFYRELIGVRAPEADQMADKLAFALAHLRFRVLEAPEWWRIDTEKRHQIPGSHCDKNVIVEVLNSALNAESLYLDKLKQDSKDAKDILTKRFESGEIEKELDVDGEREQEPSTEEGGPKPEFLGV